MASRWRCAQTSAPHSVQVIRAVAQGPEMRARPWHTGQGRNMDSMWAWIVPLLRIAKLAWRGAVFYGRAANGKGVRYDSVVLWDFGNGADHHKWLVRDAPVPGECQCYASSVFRALGLLGTGRTVCIGSGASLSCACHAPGIAFCSKRDCCPRTCSAACSASVFLPSCFACARKTASPSGGSGAWSLQCRAPWCRAV